MSLVIRLGEQLINVLDFRGSWFFTLLEEVLAPSVGWGVGMALVEALTLTEGELVCWQLTVGSDCLSFHCFASNLSHEAPQQWRGTS